MQLACAYQFLQRFILSGIYEEEKNQGNAFFAPPEAAVHSSVSVPGGN